MKVVDFGNNVVIIFYGIFFFILAELAVIANQIVDQVPLRISEELFDGVRHGVSQEQK